VVVVYPAAWGSVYASLDGPDMPTRNSDLTGRGNYFSDHVFAVKDPEPYLQFDFGVEIGLATDRVVSTATAERQRASRGAFDLRTAQAMGVAGAVGATLFAACVAIPQSLVLRPSVPRAYRWIPASTGCALVASACFGIAAVVDASIWGGTDGYSVLGYGGHLGLLVAALVFFSITGRVLDRLLREPYHEGEEHGGR
jgi:hypothetical protein